MIMEAMIVWRQLGWFAACSWIVTVKMQALHMSGTVAVGWCQELRLYVRCVKCQEQAVATGVTMRKGNCKPCSVGCELCTDFQPAGSSPQGTTGEAPGAQRGGLANGRCTMTHTLPCTNAQGLCVSPHQPCHQLPALYAYVLDQRMLVWQMSHMCYYKCPL